MRSKTRIFWPIALTLLLADCTTKQLAEEHLNPMHTPHAIFGEWVRFTLAYNPGAAMGLSLGEFSRVWFTLIAFGVLAILLRLYSRTPPGDVSMAAALALVCGGAAGNLLDRLRSPLGVVDFIDLGVGDFRFYTFNLADVGVSLGAVALAILVWRREGQIQALERESAHAAVPVPVAVEGERPARLEP
jgi:signal peptidase II